VIATCYLLTRGTVPELRAAGLTALITGLALAVVAMTAHHPRRVAQPLISS
jgi:hypothetical protein